MVGVVVIETALRSSVRLIKKPCALGGAPPMLPLRVAVGHLWFLSEQISIVSATKYVPSIWSMSSCLSYQDNRSGTVHMHMAGITIHMYSLALRLL